MTDPTPPAVPTIEPGTPAAVPTPQVAAQTPPDLDSEPVFILQGNDYVAELLTRLYALAQQGSDLIAARDAWAKANAMQAWRKRHRKRPATDDAVTIPGMVKQFNMARRFGFVVPDRMDLPDVLLHANTIVESGFDCRTVGPGQRATVEAIQTNGRWKAVRVLELADMPSQAVAGLDTPPSGAAETMQ